MSNSKPDRKDRKEFRVKFNDQKKPAPTKELILGGRQREAKELEPKNDAKSSELSDAESEADESNTSKRELHIQSQVSLPKRIVEYTHLNGSLIFGSFQELSCFFEYEVNFKLIYRASNHKFSVREFHEICDAYEDTITVCLTQDNKIIGGYTPLTWEDQFTKNSTHFKTDFKRETFLFSVTDKMKYPLVKSLKNKATCCFKTFGPTFGGGYDLLIGDKCNQLPNTISYFPRNFQHPKGSNFNKRDFTGTSRKNFKLQQWQIFHVIKLHSLKTVENMNFTQMQSNHGSDNEKSLFERFKIVAKDIIKSLCSDR